MLRDLLCHHSGSPRHDWIWLPGDLSPAQMLAAMRYLELRDDIRSTFQYSNIGHLVASMAVERVSGQRWAEFTRALTDKLHVEVTFTVEELAAAADAAFKAAGYDNRAVLDMLVLAATKLISNYTNHLARRPTTAL